MLTFFNAARSTGTGRAECHLTVSWCDSRGVLRFGQRRAIIWRGASQVQPASYLGRLVEEPHLSKGTIPLAQVGTDGSPETACACLSHVHPFLLPSCLYLNRIKPLPAQAINFEIYVPIKINLKKLREGQAGLRVSLLAMTSFTA